MGINPIQIADEIENRFRRYLRTTFDFPTRFADLRSQFQTALERGERLFRGPYLHGLAPYIPDVPITGLIERGVLPPAVGRLPLLSPMDRPLYRHQVQAIERIRTGRNVIVSSGTGSGKTLTFLTPILAEILENPQPGIHALLLYPMNALVNDQLKNLRRILHKHPQIRFGRYINVEVTPHDEKQARRLHPDAPANEVVSREMFRKAPPHILVTNYAMLEYLLLRVDDSPLFQGPWRFLVVDEAHTYTGAKGGEVALLLRRLQCRVKAPETPPPQCIATSATLGTNEPERQREVLEFARQLFHVEFTAKDLIVAQKEHAAAEGGCHPNPDVYTDPTVMTACEPGASWTPQLTRCLEQSGFPKTTVQEAAQLGRKTVAAGLYRVFREDARAVLLRTAADQPRDLLSAAERVMGRQDDDAVKRLCGLVRICSLAQVPDGDARLVPCRYHLFVRGLSGAYIALARTGERTSAQLFLDPVRQTEDGLRTLELRVCRKCGQPYAHGFERMESGKRVVSGFGGLRDQRGRPLWFTWNSPETITEDEKEEDDLEDGGKPSFPRFAFHPRTGECRELAEEQPGDEEVVLWQVHAGPEMTRGCVACGGRNTITRVQADSDAAQTVVADAFYRCLPEATVPPARKEALEYPGRGRKLLAFADSRQSAAYFAPYLKNSNEEQVLRRLVCQATQKAENRLGEPIDGVSLHNQMLRLADEDNIFPVSLVKGHREERCRRAVLVEFCLPFSRRQSLEALALVACGVTLKSWEQPASLLQWLEAADLDRVVQVLLSTLRLLKAIVIPEPLTAENPAFRYQRGHDAVIAKGSEQIAGRYRLHGFAPQRLPHTQRRSSYLQRVLEVAAGHRNISPPDPSAIGDLLYNIWTGLTETSHSVFKNESVSRGIVGHQLRWEALWFSRRSPWSVCDTCQQWTAFNVLGVCPSFRCTGHLHPAQPDELLAENHYRRTWSLPAESPVPLDAREHTAQLGPKLATAYQLAFQDGHNEDEGQINVLSSSTTFELGVDLGDLEAVFLRNVPPSPANYQQRAGRAGRGIGSAAFAVTFAMPRSHDEHYFARPPLMIEGMIRPPRVELTNETIYLRHLHAVLLAEFVRDWVAKKTANLNTVGQLLQTTDQESPFDSFLNGIAEQLQRNTRALQALLPKVQAANPAVLEGRIRTAFGGAREYFREEMGMYDQAILDVKQRRQAAEDAGKRKLAQQLYGFETFLRDRLDALSGQDWVSFFSDRSVLPSYAFPIDNVTLETGDQHLKLDRDLRIALSEYVPGAAIVARGKLWRSVGVRKPWQKPLERKYYACCPNCWHVMRHLERDQVFPDGSCPVCKHDGRSPKRMTHAYLVPTHGFTTDLTTQGEDLDFERPQRIPASRVLFVPQQQEDDPVRNELGDGPARAEVRTTERAEFFVFNDGENPDGLGFRLCKFCYRQVELERECVRAHKTPHGKDCPGQGYDLVHLGHDFISCAARLIFHGANPNFTDRSFWLSLLYAMLGGMADALGIEANDLNGVIRPIDRDGTVQQEVVIFDDVPGGAGHALRLEGKDELLRVMQAAHARVATCTCGETASCYTCLRSYRNQFCHDELARAPVADYLGRLLETTQLKPDDDRPYSLPDRAGALRAAIRDSSSLDVVADKISPTGPPEIGPWYLHLLEAVMRPGTQVRLALREVPVKAEQESPAAALEGAHLIALTQAGVHLCKVKSQAPPPPYALLALGVAGEPGSRSVGFFWDTERRTAALDGETHLLPLRYNRSLRRLKEARAENDNWFQQHTEPLAFSDLFRTSPGCIVHSVKQGQRVNFPSIFAALTGKKIAACQVQDPYLLTLHQMKCLEDFLKVVPWQPAGNRIPFKLVTHLSEADPAKRYQLSPTQQKKEIDKRLEEIPTIQPSVEYRHRRYNPLHMRFIYFAMADGLERLFILERGLDIEDPQTGKARSGTYVLEFPQVLPNLLGILQLPPTIRPAMVLRS